MKVPKRVNCPCCKYPTLSERIQYEICPLCNWEDDGQDDPEADEVWGGPNGDYSLAEARENFKKYLVMYYPEKDTRICGDWPEEKEIKVKLIEKFEGLKIDVNKSKDIWKDIIKLEKSLYEITIKKIQEYEKAIKKKKETPHHP